MKDKEILVIEKSILKNLSDERFFSFTKDSFNANKFISNCNFAFLKRSSVEEDISKKQIIPYIIILDTDNRFFIYKRKGSEKRLHGKYSIGVGGHVDCKDIEKFYENEKANFKIFKLDLNLFSKLIMVTLLREIYEETGISLDEKSIDKNIEFIGIINEDISPVGKVHIGFVYLFRLDKNQKIKPVDDEISYFEFITQKDIFSFWDTLEKWSILALSLLGIDKTLIYINDKRLTKSKKSYFFNNFGFTQFVEYITKNEDVENFKLFLDVVLKKDENKKYFYFIENEEKFCEFENICHSFDLSKIKTKLS